jgi:hypothetical protein
LKDKSNVLPLSLSLLSPLLLITWSVNQQENNDGFNIEHSSDGQHWNNIGYVTSKQVAEPVAYTFTDPNSLPGINYYRLLQPDADGKSNYSEIKTINLSVTGKLGI